MKIQKLQLLKALDAVKPGLAARSVIPQMEQIIFTGQDIITYNDQISIIYLFETDFEICVNYDDLYNIINKIKEEEITFTVEGSELLITAGRTKAGLVTMNTEEINDSLNALMEQLPNDEKNNLKWQNIPTDFIEGALLCTLAASQDTSQGTLTCLYVQGSNLICSDNQRVSWYELNNDTETEFFIRAGIIKELSNFDIQRFCISDSWVHFSNNNNTIFSTRLIKGKSMDYFLKLFGVFDGDAVALPEGLKEIVESAAVMAEDDVTQNMCITMRDGKMVCKTQNVRGWVEKTVDTEFSKKISVDFQVSAKSLHQILHLPLKMIAGKDRSLFESGSFKHILMHRVSV